MITFRNEKSLKDYDSVSLAAMLRAHFIEKYPVGDLNRLDDAIQVASYLHRNDVRRGARGSHTKPAYIEHPLRVAVRLFKYFGVTDPDVLIAAVLHDTVEDHPFEFQGFESVIGSGEDEKEARGRALDFISRHIGFRVAYLVDQVSNPITPPGLSKPERVKRYQKHVEHIVEFDSRSMLIKISDWVDNAGSLHHHYEYDDKSVAYFLDRYEPLIPLYRRGVDDAENPRFDTEAVQQRIDATEVQFKMFRAGLANKSA
ncbi:SpoT-like ppGpp synthesis/degradation protein [Microbacterium phage Cece]|nr:SpoT-like ppGpp synthesis/degradation protein [Microbacterium phage Cece]